MREFHNSDGTPRVAPNGFTEAQARQIQEAKVCLHGIKDLDARAEDLAKNGDKYSDDGLHPIAREQLRRLRTDITRAYQPEKVTTRMVGGAATVAVTAAVLTLVLQLVIEEKVDLTTVGEPTKKGTSFGDGGALVDAGIYHAATRPGVTPEVSKSYVQNGVVTGFCLIAVDVDVLSEIKSVRDDGDVTAANTVAGTTDIIALDALPFVVASLGLAGQLLDQESRILDHADQMLDQASIRLDQVGKQHAQAGREFIEQLHVQQERSDQLIAFALRARDEADALFEEIFPSRRNAQIKTPVPP